MSSLIFGEEVSIEELRKENRTLIKLNAFFIETLTLLCKYNERRLMGDAIIPDGIRLYRYEIESIDITNKKLMLETFPDSEKWLLLFKPKSFDLLKIKVEALTVPAVLNSYPDFNIYPRLNF